MKGSAVNQIPRRPLRPIEDVATNQAAERAVLSHMIQKPGDIDQITSIIVADDFHDPAYKKLFALMVDLFDAGELGGSRSDAVLLSKLAGSDLLKELGGSRFILELLDIPPTSPRYHAAEVQRRASIRRLLQSSDELRDSILAGDDHTQALDNHQATIDAVLSRQADCTKSAGQLMAEFADSLDNWQPPEIMTGLPKFDERVGGFARGRLITVCAGTGGGKSALALQIASHNGMKQRPVLYLTFEMLDVEKVKRLLNHCDHLAGVNFEVDRLDDKQRGAVQREVLRHENSKLFIRHMASPKWRDVERRIREFRARHGLSLVVVDYIGLISKSDPRQTIQEKTAEVTSGLKKLAMQLQCVVLAVVQLNREAAKTKQTDLHNLADSAAVERDSDCVIAIHQPDPQDMKRRELHILKNRTGRRGKLENFEFDGARMLFTERLAFPELGR
jgi:replicative DNA helicase